MPARNDGYEHSPFGRLPLPPTALGGELAVSGHCMMAVGGILVAADSRAILTATEHDDHFRSVWQHGFNMRTLPRSYSPLKQFFAAAGREFGKRLTFGEYWRSKESPGVVFEFIWPEATEECCLIRRPATDVSSDYSPGPISAILLLIRSFVKEQATERDLPTGITVVESFHPRTLGS